MRTASAIALVVALSSLGGLAAGVLDGVTVTGWVMYSADNPCWQTLRGVLESEGASVLEASTEDPAEVADLLARSQVFLIPPSVSWEGETTEAAVEAVGALWTGVLADFLTRAGRVVAVGDVAFLRGAKLIPAEEQVFTGGAYDYGTIVAADAANVLLNEPYVVPESFAGARNTYYLSSTGASAGATPAVTTTPSVTSPTTPAPTTTPASTAGAPVGGHEGTVLLKEKNTLRAVAAVFAQHGGEVLYLGFSFRDVTGATHDLLVDACYSFGGAASALPIIEQSGVLAGGETTSLGRLEISEFTQVLALSIGGGAEISARLSDLPSVEGDRLPAVRARAGTAETVLLVRPLIQSGRWYFTAANPGAEAESFSLCAIAVPALVDIGPWRPETAGEVKRPPIPALEAYLGTPGGLLGITQYRIEVPDTASSLGILLSASGPSSLYLRFGKPVEVANGLVHADFAAPTIGGSARLSLAGTFLKAGVYYVGVEAQTVPTTYEMQVDLAP